MKQIITLAYESTPTNNFAGHCGTKRKIVIELPGDLDLSELLEQFEYFIKAIGYFPPDNSHLDYVDNDTTEPKSIP